MSTVLEPSPAAYAVGDRVAVHWPNAASAPITGVITAVASVFGEWDYEVRLPDGGTAHYTEDEIVGEAGPPAPAPDAAPAPPPNPAGQAMLVQMPVAWIDPDDDNERGADLGDLRELAASIAAQGILEPLRVYKIAEKRFRLSSGHRRHAAAVALGLERVPAILIPPPASAAAAVLERLVINLQRRDLSPLEEARGYQALRDQGLTQAEIAAKVGKDQSRISRILALLKQPEPIQAALAAGTLTPAHVEQLSRVQEDALSWTETTPRPAAEVRAALAAKAVEQGWGVRDLTTSVDNHLSTQRNIREYRKSDEARKERETAAADRAAREPERTATLAAEAQARDAARKAAEAARRQRLEVAQAAIRATVGWPTVPGQVTTSQLALAARWLVAFATADPKVRAEWQTEIDQAAQTGASIQGLIARIAVGLLTPDWEGRTLGAYHAPAKWAEQTWNLNAAISAALAAAGLDGDAPPPADPAAAEPPETDALDPTVYCTLCRRDDDAYEYEVNEAGELACPNCGALAPADDALDHTDAEDEYEDA